MTAIAKIRKASLELTVRFKVNGSTKDGFFGWHRGTSGSNPTRAPSFPAATTFPETHQGCPMEQHANVGKAVIPNAIIRGGKSFTAWTLGQNPAEPVLIWFRENSAHPMRQDDSAQIEIRIKRERTSDQDVMKKETQRRIRPSPREGTSVVVCERRFLFPTELSIERGIERGVLQET